MTSPRETLFFFADAKAQAIIEALGLPAATQSITLRMTRGDFVQITCTYAPQDLDALVPHLQTMRSNAFASTLTDIHRILDAEEQP
jgi:hypothetical protein